MRLDSTARSLTPSEKSLENKDSVAPMEPAQVFVSTTMRITMPAESEKQRKAAGIALAAKRAGKKPKKGTASAQMAKGMTENQLEDYARKPGKKKR